MQVEVTTSEQDQARLSVTLTPQEVDGAIEATYQRLTQRIKIPGFRPGRAPRQLLLRNIGEDYFYDQATDEALRRWYPKALKDSGVEALDQGKLDLDGDEHEHLHPGEEFRFVAMVPVKPQVELPNYGEIKIPAPPVVVSEADVDALIDRLRLAHATLEPATARPAAIGDVVRMNIHGTSEGEQVISQEDYQFDLVDEKSQEEGQDKTQFPGLSKEMVGARPGDIREVVLTLPLDYDPQELAGKSLSLRIVVKEVLRRVLPDLDNEFVAKVSEQTDVVGLRELIRRNLENEKKQEARNKVATEVVDSLIARTNLTAPEVMVSQEQDRQLREHRQYFERGGLQFDQFLMAAGKSEEQYREDLRPPAERSVKRELILDAVAKAEGIAPSQADVDRQLQLTSRAVSHSARDYERLAHSDRLRETIEEELRRQRALARLVEITSGLNVDADDDLESEDSDTPSVDPSPQESTQEAEAEAV